MNPLTRPIQPAFGEAVIEPEFSARRERILIVDDSAVVRRSFAKLLSAKYECHEAASVLDAFEIIKTNEFELVITDVIMPGLSGIELLRKIVSNYPQTAVIVVSGVDRPQRALDAVRLGAFDYLIKPCDHEVLEFTVQRALERRSLLINAKRYKDDLEARNQELLRGKQQLERLQAQIVHTEKMASIGQLAAGIAHELNNPVGYLYGNLDLLDGAIGNLLRLMEFYENAELPPELAARAEEIRREIDYDATIADLSSIISDCRAGAERVRDIVQNLRTFSRLDEAEFKKTDLHEGIDSTLRILSRYFTGGNITLKRNYGNLPIIDAYPAQLNQVWMNLLVNAAQAIGPDTGEVEITTWADGDDVYVKVKDSGKGIATQDLGRIFDPFFTTKPVGEGTGLGLSISFGIVERHGGRIEVESTPGKGTSFTVVLPKKVRADRSEGAAIAHDSRLHTEAKHAFALQNTMC